jgi:hypothetical protein
MTSSLEGTLLASRPRPKVSISREPVNDGKQMFAHAIRCAATQGMDARSLGYATDLAHPGLEACSGWRRRLTADD